MQPLLKWVGSKRWITSRLIPVISRNLQNKYYEPFAGSAAMLLALEPEKAVICDTLAPLMALYRYIALEPREVWSMVRAACGDANTKDEYYDRRDRFNNYLSKGEYNKEFASLFIYLNKTGFNGLWRQNSDGEFNVPFGDHKKIKLPSQFDFILASQIFNRTTIHTIDHPDNTFNQIQKAGNGDVIFSDPPYYETFVGYDGIERDQETFQQRLCIELWQAHLRGATIIAMNSDTPETRKWYGGFGTLTSINRKQNMAGSIEGRKRWSQILVIAERN